MRAHELKKPGGWHPMIAKGKKWYRRGWGLALTLVLFAATGAVAGGQFGKMGGRLSSERRDPTEFASSVKPLILNADSDPALRYPIVNFGGISVYSVSYGWLDVSRETVRYNVVSPPNKAKDGFVAPCKELSDLNTARGTVTFHSGGKKHNLFYMPQESWGSVRSASGFMSAAVANAPGTEAIALALTDFNRALALAKPAPPAAVAQPVAPPPPEPKPAEPPAPPAVVVTAPTGARANQVAETQESPLVIRGVAMDNSGMPVVSINGTAANMRPQSAQAAEFWTDPVPLQPGSNRFEVVATNSAHAEAKLVFLVHYTPKAPNPRALAKDDIIALLQGAVPHARIVEIIKERGVKFPATADDLNDIRAAGGDDELIQAVRRAAGPDH